LWVVVGLGNPGSRYTGTRHNIGFAVLDELAARCRVEFKERRNYRVARGSMKDVDTVFLEPLTFMNRSGLALAEAFRRYPLSSECLVVVHDDLDIDTGRVKVKSGGGPGGHKGVESIIQSLGTKDFTRVKIGIGRAAPEEPVEHYVLRRFRKDEMDAVGPAVSRAVEAIEFIVTEGPEAAMNMVNRRAPGSE